MISLKHYANIRRVDTSTCNTKYSKAYAIKVGLRPLMFRMWAFKKNEIDFRSLIKRSISIVFHRIHKKKYTNIFYFRFFLRKFTQETLLQRVVSRCNVCRQRGRVVRRVVFTTAMFARLTVQLPPKPGCCVLDKMLHHNYLCLVESNKQQIEEVRSKI